MVFKMKEKSKETQQRILEAGKTEFLRKGYEKASLREIAKLAGVTTGAIYGYYADKSSLFEALVSGPANTMLRKFVSLQEEFASWPPEKQIKSMHETSAQGMTQMVEFIYDHFDRFKLIICCSVGTRYEDYIERMVDIEVESFDSFIKALNAAGKSPKPIDNLLIHMVVNATFSGVFEIVRHDMDKITAQTYVSSLGLFVRAGWGALLGL